MFSSTITQLPHGGALWHSSSNAIGVGKANGKPQMHFSAANGFPSRSYDFFLKQFTNDFSTVSLDNRGMWPEQPEPEDSVTWQDYADDLIVLLESIGVSNNNPIIGVGHSIGGSVSLHAAIKRPELFSHLILIDPASTLLASNKPNGNAHLNSGVKNSFLRKLVSSTRNRRIFWDSIQQFIDYLPTKSVYANFTKEALNDYANSGLKLTIDGKYKLNYSPEWEAHNFTTTPDIADSLANVDVQTLLLYGETSYMYRPEILANANSQFSAKVTVKVIEGAGHLAIQEAPLLSYSLITDWLAH